MRAIVVATGNIDELPAEMQEVTNTLSRAGWIVRICVGDEATRTGLLRAAGEGDADLVWLGMHSGVDGFLLADGMWPPSQVGVWLRNVNAHDVVLNSCYSAEHVEAIQRAADVDVAATIDPAGVDSTLAWQVGVYLVRSYVIGGDLQAAVRQASGFGSLQYRFIPCGGVRLEGGRRRMPGDRIEEQLQELLRALHGEPRNGYVGLVSRVNDIQTTLHSMAAQQQEWREKTDRRLEKLEQTKPVTMSARSVYISSAIVLASILLLLAVVVLANSGRWG